LKELIKFREGRFEEHFIPKNALRWDDRMEVYRVTLPALPDSTMFDLDSYLAKVVDQEVIFVKSVSGIALLMRIGVSAHRIAT